MFLRLSKLFLSLSGLAFAHAHFARTTYAAQVSRRDGIAVTTDPTLANLLAQNEAWAESMDETRPGFFNESAQAQHPKALWLGCSDSRVPESVITSSLPGDIFVQRNIANQVPTNDINVLSVLSYAIDHLQVDRIVIAGHTHCGGVKYCYTQAASLPKPAPNPLPPLPDPILNTWLANLYTLAVQLLDSGSNQYDNSADADADQQAAMEELTLENIKMQVQNVASLDMVKDAWKQGRDLRVVGWLYQLETGRLKDLGICVGPLGTVGCEL